MKNNFRIAYLSAIFFFMVCVSTKANQNGSDVAKKQSKESTNLFADTSVLLLTLKGNIRNLLNDRSANPKNHLIDIVYKKGDNTDHSLSVQARTRGHFRKLKENCGYPPLLLHFTKSDALNASLFKSFDKCKLVMPCQGDEYVIREWLVYKIYNLVTPRSIQARLVKVKIEDPGSKKNQDAFYGILLEEDKKMAKRNQMVSVERKLRPEQTEKDAFLKMAVFEYLIGNTDWSVQYMQNIKFVAPDSNAVVTTVPYDFDHSGLVSAPYAKPAEELEMQSVQERRYRGYCIKDMKQFDASIALFNRIKKDLYSLYTDCNYLNEKYKKATLRYLDDFYEVINNPVKLQKEFDYPCNPNGTGNIVIKGLREN